MRPAPGRVLVAGSKCYGDKQDRRRLYRHAIGVDMIEGKGVDLVHDLQRRLPEKLGKFAHIDCCSVLEHVRNPFKFAASLQAAMSPEATILLVVPWVWRVHGYPQDYWRFTPQAIEVLFPAVEWQSPRYLVHDKVQKAVPRCEVDGVRMFARSELAMVGRLR